MNELTNSAFNQLADEISIQPIGRSEIVNFSNAKVDEVITKLKVYWPLSKMILKASKLVVPPKVDKGIDEFISIVDRLVSDPNPEEKGQILEKFALVWGTVSPVLAKAKDITGPKADAIIDEVLIIGRLLSAS